MPKYVGYLKQIEYFRFEVDADSAEDARDLMWELEPRWDKPWDMDSEIVGVEELETA